MNLDDPVQEGQSACRKSEREQWRRTVRCPRARSRRTRMHTDCVPTAQMRADSMLSTWPGLYAPTADATLALKLMHRV